jgi:steroid delta-isomerase-like uncharacterized protein
MTTEDNKALMGRIYEVFNTGNLALADEVIAADAVDHQAMPGMAPGREGFKQLVTMFRAAFPDLECIIEDMLAEGDKVVTRLTMRGTHQGELMGIAPTGRPITVTGIDIVRFAQGQVVEHWGNQDDLGMLQQLGVVPAPGQGSG